MSIVSNWVNEAQNLMAVTKYDDLLNSLIPNEYQDSQSGIFCLSLSKNI